MPSTETWSTAALPWSEESPEHFSGGAYFFHRSRYLLSCWYSGFGWTWTQPKPKFTILTKCWLRYLVLYFICWDQHTINYVCLNFTTQKTGTQYQLLFPLRLNFSKNSEFWFCKNLVEFMSIISIFKTSVSSISFS